MKRYFDIKKAKIIIELFSPYINEAYVGDDDCPSAALVMLNGNNLFSNVYVGPDYDDLPYKLFLYTDWQEEPLEFETDILYEE